MGSGATKINSSESNLSICREKSDLTVCSEKNNNVITKSKPLAAASGSGTTSVPAKRIQSGKESQRSTQVMSESTSTKASSSVQTRKSKESALETKVMSLRLAPLEPITRVDKGESDVIKHLNKDLAASESQKLDLQEQIQLLQEKLSSKAQQQNNAAPSSPNPLQETVNAKDQYIVKLEKEATANQAEANRLRIKLKKRIKSLTNQLHETRQESSISQMELKAEIARQTEEIKLLKAGGSASSSSAQQEERRSSQDQDHSKIIVELSNQLSEQSERISSLEAEVSEKKKEISDLKLAISDHYDSKDAMSVTATSPNPHSSLLPQTSTDRLHSSRGRRVSKPSDRSREYKSHGYTDSFDASPTPIEDRDSKSSPRLFQRQSTALSDSDSDWGENAAPSAIHSAPPRSRVKSAVSLTSSGKRKGSLVTLNGNDDSIMDLVSASPVDPSYDQREFSNKKSTLKNHLEHTRMKNQSNSLIGPSLAFEKKADPFSDTSCEPTPRQKRAMLHTDPKVRIVKPIVY